MGLQDPDKQVIVVGIVILLIAVGLSGCTETNKTTQIIDTPYVDRYPDITRLNNSEFLIVLSMGLQYINGLIMAEDGKTYQHYFTIYNETGVRDPCIHKTDNGSLIVTYALSENNAGWLKSNDNGITWQHQGYISQGDIFSIDDIKTVNKNIYACGHSKGDRKCKFLIYDNNWKIINDSVLDGGNEWTFIPLSEQHFHAIFRMTDFPFDTSSAESYDGGMTWTNFINKTAVFNTLADPELYWLNDNTIILFGRQTIKKYDCRLVYFISKDDCKTWSDPVLIYE